MGQEEGVCDCMIDAPGGILSETGRVASEKKNSLFVED